MPLNTSLPIRNAPEWIRFFSPEFRSGEAATTLRLGGSVSRPARVASFDGQVVQFPFVDHLVFRGGIRRPKHVGVDLTGPMRTDRVARVRAGFGRAALAQQRTLFLSRWELSATDRGY